RAGLPEERVLFVGEFVAATKEHGAENADEFGALGFDAGAEDRGEAPGLSVAEPVVSGREAFFGKQAGPREAEVHAGVGEVAVEGVRLRIAPKAGENAASGNDG